MTVIEWMILILHRPRVSSSFKSLCMLYETVSESTTYTARCVNSAKFRGKMKQPCVQLCSTLSSDLRRSRRCPHDIQDFVVYNHMGALSLQPSYVVLALISLFFVWSSPLVFAVSHSRYYDHFLTFAILEGLFGSLISAQFQDSKLLSEQFNFSILADRGELSGRITEYVC